MNKKLLLEILRTPLKFQSNFTHIEDLNNIFRINDEAFILKLEEELKKELLKKTNKNNTNFK